MKFKKFASLALAGAMSLSLAVPAFASGNSTEITGNYQAVDIEVVVSQTATAIINPYGLDLEVNSDAADASSAKVTISGQQIVTTPMSLKNKTGMDLQVSASMTASVKEGSNMRFVSTSTGGVGATKTVFAYLQAKQEPALVGTDNSGVAVADVAAKFAAWAASDYDADADLLVNSAMATSTDNLVVLRAADMTGGSFQAYKAGSVALVRLAGDCVASPTTGSWAAPAQDGTGGDGFTVNVAYTFKPASIEKYDVTMDVQKNGTTGDATPDLTKAAAGDTVTINVTIGDASSADVTVADADGGTVTVTGGTNLQSSGAATFTMPEGGATVTVAFTA